MVPYVTCDPESPGRLLRCGFTMGELIYAERVCTRKQRRQVGETVLVVHEFSSAPGRRSDQWLFPWGTERPEVAQARCGVPVNSQTAFAPDLFCGKSLSKAGFLREIRDAESLRLVSGCLWRGSAV